MTESARPGQAERRATAEPGPWSPDAPSTGSRDASIRAIVIDCMRRRAAGEPVSDESLIADHGDLMPQLAGELQKLRWIEAAEKSAEDDSTVRRESAGAEFATPADRSLPVRCPLCLHRFSVVVGTRLGDFMCESCGTSISLVDGDDESRQAEILTTLGHFELISQLGIGGFGTVWKARDTELDRIVAIKIPRKGELAPEEIEHFLHEAQVAAQLQHRNIVSIHEVGRSGLAVYIVSDLIRGLPLSDWMKGRSPTYRQSAELCVKIASALDYAHDAGVVHRDLKPANIMIDAEGEPHIMDFGLAKRDAAPADSGQAARRGTLVTMTVEGQVLGTPAYMSPEQARGKAHQSDRRSDVYSLGVILYELVAGELPFRGNVRKMIRQVIEVDAPPLRRSDRRIPRDLETIALKCLEKDPARRYDTAGELAEELRRFLRGEPIHARPIGRVERTVRWCRRKPVAAGWIATLLVTIVGAIATAVWIAADQAAQRVALGKSASRLSDALDRQKAETRMARSLLLAAQASEIVDQTPQRAVLLAVEAVRLSQIPDASGKPPPSLADVHQKLRDVMQRVGGRGLSGHDGDVTCSAIARGGLLLFTGGADGTVRTWNVADPRAPQSAAVLRGHHGAIHCLAVSPSGRHVVTGGADKTVRVWDVIADAQQTPPTVLPGHTAGVFALDVSPDGRWIVSGGDDNAARLWDMAARDIVESCVVLEGHAGRVASVAVDPDSRWIATASHDGTIRLWDTARSDPAAEPVVLRDLGKRVARVRFSPDGRYLASASDDRAARLWQRTPGGVAPNPVVLSGHRAALRDVAFDPESRRLATASVDYTARLWDLRAAFEPEPASIELAGHSGIVRGVGFSPDGQTLITSSEDRTVRLWDLPTERPASDPVVLRGHDASVWSFSIDPQGRRLVTTSRDATARVWDFSAPRSAGGATVLDAHDRGILDIAVGRRLAASASSDRTVRLWDMPGGKIAPVPIAQFKHDATVRHVAISPDEHWLASADASGAIRLWNLHEIGTSEPRVLENEFAGIADVAFTADSRWIVGTATNERKAVGLSGQSLGKIEGTKGTETLRLWDLESGDPIARSVSLAGHTGPIAGIAASVDGRYLATAGDDREARLWDLSSPNPTETVVVLAGHRQPVSAVAISPDNRWVGTGSADGEILLWDMAARASRLVPIVLAGHEPRNAVVQLAFTPDGRRLVSAGLDKTARLWNIEGDPAAGSVVLSGHERALFHLAVSKNGRWLVTAGEDHAIRRWDLRAPHPEKSAIVLRGHTGRSGGVAIDPSGRWIISASQDGTIRIWPLELETLLQHAREVAGRELTDSERSRYLFESGS